MIKTKKKKQNNLLIVIKKLLYSEFFCGDVGRILRTGGGRPKIDLEIVKKK